MARFGSSRSSQRASSNSNSNNTNDEIISDEPISGFAASAAAGGVAASIMTNAAMPPQQHRRQQSTTSSLDPRSTLSGQTNNTNTSTTSRSKSGSSRITSGISTLFRRQPSPDFFNDGGFGSNNTPTPPQGQNNRDPGIGGGVHYATANNIPTGGSGMVRKMSGSKSRSSKQHHSQLQQPAQQYSATQRQLLSGSPAVDIPLNTSSTLSGTSGAINNTNNYTNTRAREGVPV